MDKIKFAKLISFVTLLMTKSDSRLEGNEIAELDKLTTTEVAPAKPNVDGLIDLLNAMKDGRKIEAIKAYRSLTGEYLKDAKDIIEANWIAKPTLNEHDELFIMLSEGRASDQCQKDAAQWIRKLHQ